MVASIASGTTARYYLSRTAYYLDGSEPEGSWIAGTDFGIEAGQPLDADLFERLHAATDANGRTLLSNGGNRLEQVGGYDVTFSAPKSMSLLWAMADEELRSELEAVQRHAVEAAIALLDANAAYCRRGKDGLQLEKVALSVAGFQHGEARPAPHADGEVFADFALHTHAVALSVAVRADGTVGRLDGRPLFSWKMAAGAQYHRFLAQGLRKIGFAVEVTGKNGIFEVAGVDAGLCAYFSARRKEIVDELEELGLETADAPALASARALTTRRSKKDMDGVDRHAFWLDKCLDLGRSPEQVIAQARERSQWAVQNQVDRPDLIDAVLAQLTERGSTFERRQLVAAVAAALVEVPDERTLDAELARLETERHIVPLAHDGWGHAIYSTPEIIALERELFSAAQRLGALAAEAPHTDNVDALLAVSGLNPEQAEAARTACAAVSLTIIEGGPGVGKTTLLGPVTQAWQDLGWRVIGASNAWKIASQLQDDLDIEARAIDSWTARAAHGKDFLTDRTVLLVDEAGLLTSRQMATLLAEVDRAQKSGLQVVVRLVGDRRQLQPIGGPGLRIVADAIGVQRVDTIVRQRHAWARDAVTAFGRGRAPEALAGFVEHDLLHYGGGQMDTVRRMAQAWNQQRQIHGDAAVLMIAKSNRQVLALNAAARLLLRAQGQLPADTGMTFQAATPSGQSHTLELVKGDAVRFLKRVDALGVINGTTGTIDRVERTGNEQFEITVRVGGRKVRFAPSELADDKGRLLLAHAYASSCYGAQGITTEYAFVLADPGMDRHDIFVAASRAREATHLFVDQKGLDNCVMSARLLNDRQRQVDDEERLTTLAASFSAARVKVSTLDYLPPVQPLEYGHEPQRQRANARAFTRD